MIELLSRCRFPNRCMMLFSRAKKGIGEALSRALLPLPRDPRSRPGFALSLIELFFFVQRRYCDRPNARGPSNAAAASGLP